MLFLAGARATTPDIDAPSPPRNASPEQDPCLPPDVPQGRQRAIASIPFIDPGQVLARITTSLSDTTSGIVNDIRSFYAVPDGTQSQGLDSNEYRAGMKRRADTISRSQYEVYSFLTKHDLSEAAADELLNMLSNVSDPSQ